MPASDPRRPVSHSPHRPFLASPRGDVPTTIADFISLKVSNLIDRLRRLGSVANPRHWTFIAVVRMKMVVHVALERVRTMKPRASTDEDTTRKPFWAVVAVRSTAIRSGVIVTVRAVRGDTNVDGDLSLYLRSGRRKEQPSNSREREIPKPVHNVSSILTLPSLSLLGHIGIFHAEDVPQIRNPSRPAPVSNV
jgi:hypothetical protein